MLFDDGPRVSNSFLLRGSREVFPMNAHAVKKPAHRFVYDAVNQHGVHCISFDILQQEMGTLHSLEINFIFVLSVSSSKRACPCNARASWLWLQIVDLHFAWVPPWIHVAGSLTASQKGQNSLALQVLKPYTLQRCSQSWRNWITA